MSRSPAALMDAHFQDVTDLLCRLVAFPTVQGEAEPGCPFGRPVAQALDLMLREGERLGFRTACLDHKAGYIELGEGDDYVMMVAHLDVVPAGDGWTRPPFAPTREGQRLYGRGTGDNKCAAAAGLYALLALRESGLPLTKRVRLVLGCDEETGMTDLEHYFSREPLPVFGFIPDSDYPIVNREKGIVSATFACPRPADGLLADLGGGAAANVVPPSAFALLPICRLPHDALARLGRCSQVSLTQEDGLLRVTAQGRAAHACHPQQGDNALTRLARVLLQADLPFAPQEQAFLQFLQDGLSPTDGSGLGINGGDEYGELTCNLGLAHTEKDGFYALVNLRYPVTWQGEDLRRTLETQGTAAQARLLSFDDMPPLNVSGENPYVRKLQQVYTARTGKPAELLCIGGGTYARACRGRCVGFGVCGHTEHMPDEFIDLDELRAHAQMMAEALAAIAL